MRRNNPFLRGPSGMRRKKRDTRSSGKNPFFKEDEEDGDVSRSSSKGEKLRKRMAPKIPEMPVSSTGVEEDEEEEEEEEEVELEFDPAAELPEWLSELSDDLEVYIAQREFEDAVSLIFRARAYCDEHADVPIVREAKSKSVRHYSGGHILFPIVEIEFAGSNRGPRTFFRLCAWSCRQTNPSRGVPGPPGEPYNSSTSWEDRTWPANSSWTTERLFCSQL